MIQRVTPESCWQHFANGKQPTFTRVFFPSMYNLLKIMATSEQILPFKSNLEEKFFALGVAAPPVRREVDIS